mgnify:CR=1 FL=1
MSVTLSAEIIHEVADRCLSGGVQPTIETVCEHLKLDDPVPIIADELDRWWSGLSGRVVIAPESVSDAPEALTRAVRMLWQDAVKEAASHLATKQETLDFSAQVLRQESEELLVSSRADYESLETRYRREVMKVDEAQNQIKVLEAEITVLKSNLTGEVTLRKQAEEKLQDSRNDIKRSAKTLEDAKRTFDGRMKDEQSHSQELLAKVEGELRHYRNNLELVRDEAGKKESALTKGIHELQSEVAKRDVKIETLQGQLKSLESELKITRTDTGSQTRQLAQATSKILSETNKNKRSEERVKQLEADLKSEQQRVALSSSESMRKEADLRHAVKTRDEELMRVKASISGLQKKLIAQEEQIRRLHAQANI